MSDEARVRPAEARDRAALGRLAGSLVRFHHELDPRRYLAPPEGVEDGYGGWLARELERPEVALWVAERAGRLVGYAYGRVEARDWMRLLDAHAELHDVWVDEPERGRGTAEPLVRACVDALLAKGAPRVVLSTGHANARAQRFFARLGFRPTMLEMTRD